MKKHQEETALAVQESLPPGLAKQFVIDAGAGFEGMTREDYALPFIILLQSNSPQLDPTKAEYNEDAKQGMFINTVTGEVFKELHVIPCAYAFRVIERKQREMGGNFIARYTREEAPRDYITDERGQHIRQNGNVLVDTAYHYVMVLDDQGFPSEAVLIFKSTQLAKSKKWNAKMTALKLKHGSQIITPPMYSSIYKLTSGKESNEKGSWFGYIIERVGYVQDADLLELAKRFSETATEKRVADEPEVEVKVEEADEVM